MSTEWMTAGRHPVDLGPSFVRALKARAGSPKPTKTKIPVNDFHSFRCWCLHTFLSSLVVYRFIFSDKFMPESIDNSKTGSVEAKGGADNSFRVERPSTQVGHLSHSPWNHSLI